MIKITYINFWQDKYNDKYLSKFIKNNLINIITRYLIL